jgi:hypothetical protein
MKKFQRKNSEIFIRCYNQFLTKQVKNGVSGQYSGLIILARERCQRMRHIRFDAELNRLQNEKKNFGNRFLTRTFSQNTRNERFL